CAREGYDPFGYW
nr:immunoglobulin heavy chain junction region [Mus musculus]MBK4187452.1 immunoglobulin heavy chain junction region [Mus musculus]MBK4187453.1 immunoglobulin heavy chain junction region [Mus musculus]MBK4187454.1 immunoglobulin heavy chain junction region [Mus musculus]MBK4187455.1 immunoglobulin heavy chain junction region [Mus musculus]